MRKLQKIVRERITFLKQNRSGMTLIELLVVLAIIGILVSISVPSMVGYVEHAKETKYIMETRSVRQSIELYLLDHSVSDEMEMWDFMDGICAKSLNSENHILADYLTIECSEGASIQNVSLEQDRTHVCEMVYQVDGYTIELKNGDYSVTKP